MRLKEIIKNKLVLALCVLIILIDISYPITFTYDSGHYFSYFGILAGNEPWANWDPARGIIFPLFLKVLTDLFGQTMASLLLPMIVFHLAVFLFSIYFVFNAIPTQMIRSKINEGAIILSIFLFIAIDPLILGFYHAELTEYIASFVAFLSCLLSYNFYKKSLETNRLNPGFFIILSLLVIFSWHMKQPYVGAALFPLLLTSFLIMIIKKNWVFTFRLILWNLSVVALLIVSIIVWNLILPDEGPASNPYRSTEGFLSRVYAENLSLITKSPRVFFANFRDDYFALANLYHFDQVQGKIEKIFSITRASENNDIGYRMYEYGESNMSIPVEYPETYMENIRIYSSFYFPPKFLNQFLQYTTPKSTVLFSVLYLILPIIFSAIFVIVVLTKIHSNWLVIIYLLCGSPLLNALEHSLLNNPIDRYLFWGYPLLLLSLCSIVLISLEFIAGLINSLWRKAL